MKPRYIILLVCFIIIIITSLMIFNKLNYKESEEGNAQWDAFPEGVNWNGEIYVLLYPNAVEIDYYTDDEELVKKYHPVVEYEIGKVNDCTNDSLKNSGNSNCMKKGTKLYKIQGVSTNNEIAGKLADGLFYRFIKQNIPD